MITRSLLFGLAAPLFLVLAGCSGSEEAGAAETPQASIGTGTLVTVYKSPTCGCCTAWEEHLRESGFRVESVPETNMGAIKQHHNVPAALGSCHTAVVDGYVVEGHVPADAIERLLAERPDVHGIAVPGMPAGSPGMEVGYEEKYEVYTFRDGQAVEVFATY